MRVHVYISVSERETEMHVFMLALALKTNRFLVEERCIYVCVCASVCVSLCMCDCIFDFLSLCGIVPRGHWPRVCVCICLRPPLSIHTYSSI
jgi:hypothetical protein